MSAGLQTVTVIRQFYVLVFVPGGDRTCFQKPAGSWRKETEKEEKQKGCCQGPKEKKERYNMCI